MFEPLSPQTTIFNIYPLLSRFTVWFTIGAIHHTQNACPRSTESWGIRDRRAERDTEVEDTLAGCVA